jgi:hypothetical protein
MYKQSGSYRRITLTCSRPARRSPADSGLAALRSARVPCGATRKKDFSILIRR